MANPPDSSQAPTTAQPKISQKLILRTAILLFALAGLFYGYEYVQSQHGDFDHGSVASAGLIAAIEIKGSGQEAVIIKPDGTISGTRDWKDGSSDGDLAWEPDGRFLYFVSDRPLGETYHLYRRNPDEDVAKPMTSGSRGRGYPIFPAEDLPDVNDDMLMICGGTVQGFDTKTKNTPQLLPPATSNITQASEEGAAGSEAEFQTMYGGLGTAFRYARYCKSKEFIATVMEREGGEILVIQGLSPENGKLPRPMPIVAGDHVDFDVSPKDGTVVFSVQSYKFPEPENVPPQVLKKGPPFLHGIGIFDPEKKSMAIVGASKDNRICFGKPSVSPDGSSLLVGAGRYDPANQKLSPEVLVAAPLQAQGLSAGSPIVKGQVYEPSWSPDGSKIVFAMQANGKRDIYTATKDGSSQTNITAGKGDFMTPIYSPQTPPTATH